MFRRCLMVCCVLSLLLSSIGVAAATHYTLTTLNPAGADTTACGLALASWVMFLRRWALRTARPWV